MNVYDFDETIIYGDSEDYFFKYVLDNIKDIDKEIVVNYLNRSHVSPSIDRTLLEYSYKEVLTHIKDLDSFLEDFWQVHFKYIKNWYLNQKRSDDVIISATPRFILEKAVKRLGVKWLIATEFDLKNYKVIGANCYKEEKVNRYKCEFGDTQVDNFYSDSDSDIYMAKIAKCAYKVKDDEITN